MKVPTADVIVLESARRLVELQRGGRRAGGARRGGRVWEGVDDEGQFGTAVLYAALGDPRRDCSRIVWRDWTGSLGVKEGRY